MCVRVKYGVVSDRPAVGTYKYSDLFGMAHARPCKYIGVNFLKNILLWNISLFGFYCLCLLFKYLHHLFK